MQIKDILVFCSSPYSDLKVQLPIEYSEIFWLISFKFSLKLNY